MNEINEKRKAPRIEQKLPIKIKEGDEVIVVETKNISASGAYFTTEKPMPLMSKVMITLLLPNVSGRNKKATCAGTVVRVLPTVLQNRSLYETAIFFDEITVNAKNLISKYVKKIMLRTT